MTEYINAQEARATQELVIKTANTKELDDVFACIKEAINTPSNTSHSTYYYETLSRGAVKRLEELGYKVSQYTDARNETTVTISW